MPTLTYQTSTGLHGGPLNGRLLIGRKLAYGISFADNTVSRLHAWIDPDAAGWILIDTGSRTGTFVNDQAVTRHVLSDGDVIRVGSNALRFSVDDSLPDGVKAQAWSAPSDVVRKDGILFQCACGAPLWVGNDLAGKRGICRHCRQPVTVPALIAPAESRAVPSPAPAQSRAAPPPGFSSEKTASTEAEKYPAAEPLGSLLARAAEPFDAQRPRAAEPFDARPARKLDTLAEQTAADKSKKCSICHSSIAVGELFVTCPDCAMHYHAECWQENMGCSSYGCTKVNCLKPADEPLATAVPKAQESSKAETEIAPPGFPWELILLAASIISLLGAMLFGGLSALVVLGCVVMMIKRRPLRWGLILTALVVGLIGVVLGLVLSDYLYFSSAHTPMAIARHIHF